MSRLKTLVFFSVDDLFLRNEWAGDITVVSSKEIEPEEDLKILDLLEDFDTPSTLFIPGKIAELFPAKLKEVATRGFEVAAHGYRHENLCLLKEAERKKRVLKSVNLLEKCIGKEVLGWRSPGLHIDDSLYKILKETRVKWCSNIELPLHFRSVPLTYGGKMELPIASVDLKLYQKGFNPAKVCDIWLSALKKGNEIFTIVIHPWVQLNSADRLHGLKLFLELATSRENVEFCMGSAIYRQCISQPHSTYGSMLSATARLWKQFSKQAQAPLSMAQKVFSQY